ncbi:MAG: hypothetical protein ABSB53_03945 [Nitrososphaerales archaeon]
MKVGLMAIGAFILGLGFAMIWACPSIPNLVYEASTVGLGVGISVSDAIAISIWFLWTGILLLPSGLAILTYGIGAQKSPPKIGSTETSTQS